LKRAKFTMEVPDPPLVYNGAQRGAAVASDIEVVPDNEDEATMPGSTMADRHAISSDMDFDDEVSRRSIEVAVVHSPAIAQDKGETMCSEVTTSAYQRVPATSQQRCDPIRRSETSGRHSRQSDSEASGIMYRRRRRIHDSGKRGSGEQRRSLEDLRAELTEELRFQQAMFLSARDQLATRQDEMSTQTQVAIEGLRDDMLRIVNGNRQVQPPLAQVGGVPSTSQTEVRKLEDVSQSSHQAAVVQLAQGDRMSVRSMGSNDTRGQSRGSALVDAASVVGPRHEPVGSCSQYELGGPGIPQVTTGGMPLGVPPGVYLTPEVAITQQYMNRESQMIPGGMPSGIPSSVYRTPVDAMSHSLVNRQWMNSQLANTGSGQYSLDLFTPAETP